MASTYATVLSRLTKVGLARETTQWTYLAPAVSVPWSQGSVEHVIDPLRDESIRANDSVLQGVSQGPQSSVLDFTINGYPDIFGHWLAGIGLADTVTPGVTTALSANSAANATTISLTADITVPTTLKVSDAAGANTEYVTVTAAPTGSGPYLATIATGGGTGGNSMKYAHTAAGGSVVSQSLHTFKDARTFATQWPTYSWTTDDGTSQLGWPGCVMSDLSIKIDPKGFVTVNPKYMGFPPAAQSTFAYAAGANPPVVGWAWTVTNAGGASTRGKTMDYTLKRPVEGVWSSTGLPSPREVFPGALEADGAYKAIFDSMADMNLFVQGTQQATVHTLTQPLASGGAVLTLTQTQSAYLTGKRDLSGQYVMADFGLSGIANTTDSGPISATLSNYVSTAY